MPSATSKAPSPLQSPRRNGPNTALAPGDSADWRLADPRPMVDSRSPRRPLTAVRSNGQPVVRGRPDQGRNRQRSPVSEPRPAVKQLSRRASRALALLIGVPSLLACLFPLYPFAAIVVSLILAPFEDPPSVGLRTSLEVDMPIEEIRRQAQAHLELPPPRPSAQPRFAPLEQGGWFVGTGWPPVGPEYLCLIRTPGRDRCTVVFCGKPGSLPPEVPELPVQDLFTDMWFYQH